MVTLRSAACREAVRCTGLLNFVGRPGTSFRINLDQQPAMIAGFPIVLSVEGAHSCAHQGWATGHVARRRCRFDQEFHGVLSMSGAASRNACCPAKGMLSSRREGAGFRRPMGSRSLNHAL